MGKDIYLTEDGKLINVNDKDLMESSNTSKLRKEIKDLRKHLADSEAKVKKLKAINQKGMEDMARLQKELASCKGALSQAKGQLNKLKKDE